MKVIGSNIPTSVYDKRDDVEFVGQKDKKPVSFSMRQNFGSFHDHL